MPARILDGKALAERLQREQYAPACAAFQQRFGRAVGLAIVVVGTRHDSATYVRMKQKASASVGMQSWKMLIDLPHVLQQEQQQGDQDDAVKTAQAQVVAEIFATVRELNAREDVDGVIVQLPLPYFCDTDAILRAVLPAKDVDGLHPANHAALFHFATQKATPGGLERPPFSVACAPAACLEMLTSHDISLEGKQVVMVGRCDMVGLPMSLLCLHYNATVTICHTFTKDLPARVRQADILIVAISRAQFIPGAWIKPGAVVIDVGVNSIADSSKKSGYRLVGDVHFEQACEHASAITPVPGGLGPVGIAMLLRNTLDSAYRHKNAVPPQQGDAHQAPASE